MRATVAFCFVVCFAWLLTVAPNAGAQPKLETKVSSQTVEVGQPFELELEAVVVEGDSPSAPTLTTPSGIEVIRGPSVGTRREMSFINGTFETRKGITATWTLVARREGTYVIGPPSVTWQGSHHDGQKVQVKVVPEGTGARRRGRRDRFGRFDDPFDFDPFDLLRGGRRDRDPKTTAPLVAPEDYEVEHADDPVAFLRATVTPTRVYVGEQVTFRVYAYGARGPFEEVNASEASRPKFLSHVIVENSYRQPRYSVEIDGARYSVVKTREVALFPLEAGNLEIGAMRMGFRGRGYPMSAPHRGLVRHSKPLRVSVVEPPLHGRPAGYRLGDVGTFKLEASVEPRAIRQGEAVGVVVTVDGRGYPPESIRLPERHGVEWLKPETNVELRETGSVISGTRRLRYVVKVSEAGAIELGEVTLPYFDPDTGAYDVARARLGRIDVEPSAASPAPSASAAGNAPPRVRLSELATARATLGPPPEHPPYLADERWFWAFLLGGPVGIALAAGASRALGAALERKRRAGGSLRRQAQQALDEAEAARSTGDRSLTAAALERALYAGVESACGLKARGVLRRDLDGQLVGSGIAKAHATEVVAILDACEALRFRGEAEDVAPLVRRTRNLVSNLGGRA